ncbi:MULTISPECIES: uracil-DNA glycosylase [Alphaproteobacteria]|uniref:Type-4 uracil-DNA glycosylase n=2 Tax=Alphaproteobacteria TaxID=28211 RepID=A0A512HG31_9HYPH|nr:MULTISPECIES: uracil-DNA glycosylase [Alphaproteobacteria]GEO84414.1 uracil-DNA glycosylase [Ciceribacter naphthalenivorans]GLR22377.1 uracil-DNA glycosylase [Ciceribacter naphthalenivorans]GLT05233.1 uracil-DNA glycosylase [Sphingomonas psychrolutea]
MITARDMTPAELAALLHFHAEAGVEWLVEDDPVNRIAEFAEQRAARNVRAPAAAALAASEGAQPSTARTRPSAPPPPKTASPSALPAIPDEHAITEARFAAESARSLSELGTAVAAFAGCNLKTSARSTIFASGEPANRIMVIGPMPSADDDREGVAFSGRAGLLLDRMLAAIGLARETVLISTVIPWRPPGDRAPSVPEAAICRPFIERQIELAEPKAVLLFGNFTARFFFGETGTIHALRGEWRDIACGNHAVPAIATLHPQELLTAPASKALAWRDLKAFADRLAEG